MPTYHLFAEEGNFYKANLHTHSIFSDGAYTPEKLKSVYQSLGYSIVAFTDHRVIVPHTELQDEDFLPITGIEININEEAERRPKGWPVDRTYHLNFFSKIQSRDTFFPYDPTYSVENAQKLIDDGAKEGFLAQYNHARWSFQTLEDFKDLRGLFSFEVYNHLGELGTQDGWTEGEYDWYIRFGGHAAAVATDDCHCRSCPGLPNQDCGGGWTMIHAPELTYEAILAAMERKECYASTGPEIYTIDFTTEPGQLPKVSFTCSPCWNIAIMSNSQSVNPRWNSRKYSAGDTLTALEAELPEDFTFFRVVCKDGKGKAISRAYFADEFGL